MYLRSCGRSTGPPVPQPAQKQQVSWEHEWPGKCSEGRPHPDNAELLGGWREFHWKQRNCLAFHSRGGTQVWDSGTQVELAPVPSPQWSRQGSVHFGLCWIWGPVGRRRTLPPGDREGSQEPATRPVWSLCWWAGWLAILRNADLNSLVWKCLPGACSARMIQHDHHKEADWLLCPGSTEVFIYGYRWV